MPVVGEREDVGATPPSSGSIAEPLDQGVELAVAARGCRACCGPSRTRRSGPSQRRRRRRRASRPVDRSARRLAERDRVVARRSAACPKPSGSSATQPVAAPARSSTREPPPRWRQEQPAVAARSGRRPISPSRVAAREAAGEARLAAGSVVSIVRQRLALLRPRACSRRAASAIRVAVALAQSLATTTTTPSFVVRQGRRARSRSRRSPRRGRPAGGPRASPRPKPEAEAAASAPPASANCGGPHRLRASRASGSAPPGPLPPANRTAGTGRGRAPSSTGCPAGLGAERERRGGELAAVVGPHHARRPAAFSHRGRSARSSSTSARAARARVRVSDAANGSLPDASTTRPTTAIAGVGVLRPRRPAA